MSIEQKAGAGWKLAPVEPTEEMLREGAAKVRDFMSGSGVYPRTGVMWAAMLAAAPTLPPAEGIAGDKLAAEHGDLMDEWMLEQGVVSTRAQMKAEIATLTARLQAAEAELARIKAGPIVYGRVPPARLRMVPADEAEHCIACDKPMKPGDLYYPDASGGEIHAECCGPERESYTGADGDPLAEGEPIPEPLIWEPVAERIVPAQGDEVARLRGALEFYANPDNWIDTPPWDGDPEMITPKAIPVLRSGEDGNPCDCGDVARAALAIPTTEER